MADPIPLADVLSQVASELLEADAAAKARGKSVMQFDECEVEFAVSAKRSGNCGVKLWVVNVGAEAENVHSNKIRVKFKSPPGGATQAAHFDTESEGPELKRQ